jgi:hypothetical protein
VGGADTDLVEKELGALAGTPAEPVAVEKQKADHPRVPLGHPAPHPRISEEGASALRFERLVGFPTASDVEVGIVAGEQVRMGSSSGPNCRTESDIGSRSSPRPPNPLE